MIDKYITYTYTCADCRHAVDNYVVMLNVSLPEGTISDLYEQYPDDTTPPAGRVIGIALILKDTAISKGLYRSLPDNAPEGAAAHAYGMSYSDTYTLPNGIVLKCDDTYFTTDEVEYLVSIATGATILAVYGGDYLNDDKVTAKPNYNFSRIVSNLVKCGKVTVRYTDHEFREDERNFTHIDGYPLDHELSVESVLQFDGSKALTHLQEHLLKLLG